MPAVVTATPARVDAAPRPHYHYERAMADYLLFAGRFFIALMFVLSGINKFLFFRHGLEEVRAKNLPLPHLALASTIVVQLFCGVAIMVGFQTELASVLLAVFTLATAIVFYDFWNQQGNQRTLMLTGFLEHISIIGGFMILIAAGPGRLVTHG
ncbi:DoxX family protein [Burkholderia cenocepacia]|uniref:DoxX family protein n=1 Tax=Burkholderia cenocepacia TaxID=95486 RepID=UPI002650882D|nr:DoxX family protein [Burkholderia cenocepacia]MDN7457820.1 DoxX family protein [Burkholderia cenocepacia]